MPASPSDGDRYAQRVARLIDDLEAALLRVLADTLTKGAPDTRTWAAERLAELQWLKYRAAQGTRTALAELEQAARDAIIDAYNHGTGTAIADLEALGRPPVTVGGLPAAATALRLADEPVGLIRRAVAMVPEILGAAYSEAVAAGALDVLAGTSTRLAASQRVLDRLLADGIRGFTDSRGRRWSLDTYVEMAVRTTTGNAAVAGHVAQLESSGVDLVVVSDSPRECPLCLVPGTVVEGPVPTGRTRSEYTGDVVRIITAGGKDLTGTPDHPVLTPGGWVALKDLAVGDKVVSHDREQGFAGVMPDDVQVPALIEEAGKARLPVLLAGPTRRNLDQDVAYRKVRYVPADTDLPSEFDPALSEPVAQHLLVAGVGPASALLGPDYLGLSLVAAGGPGVGVVHGVEHSGPVLWSGVPPALEHGFGIHDRALLRRESRHVVDDGMVSRPSGNACSTEIVTDYPTADAEGGAELLRALAGKVTMDEIVSLSVSEFSGHVWDLSTEPSWYVANGIVTHNCRPWEGKVLSLSGAVAAVVMPSVTDGRPVSVSVAGTLAQAKAAGLCHPNCAHRVTAYLPGATKLVAAQHDPAGYAAKQRQREIERHIRSWKRREAVALTEDARLSARVKVRDWQRTLRAHVSEHDLKRLPYRERVGDPSTPLAH